MVAQQGFIYEANTTKFLQKKKLVASGFKPASSTSDRADLEITYGGKRINTELKITAASAGSLVLKYLIPQSEWSFGDISKEDKEKKFLSDLATNVGALSAINKKWNKRPLKTVPPTPGVVVDYAKDHRKFSEINQSIPASLIEKYYNMKDTYYLNIGTHGFYLMGNKDPNGLNARLKKAGLSPIPTFGSSATAKYRARVQAKGGGSYQFTFELSFSITNDNKSPYNIAPLKTGSVSIIEKDFVNPFI